MNVLLNENVFLVHRHQMDITTEYQGANQADELLLSTVFNRICCRIQWSFFLNEDKLLTKVKWNFRSASLLFVNVGFCHMQTKKTFLTSENLNSIRFTMRYNF